MRKINKWAISKRPYAILPSSFTETPYSHSDRWPGLNGKSRYSIQAMSAGRKNSRDTISIGHLEGISISGCTLDQFIENIDMRYGLGTQYKWDGKNLWHETDVDFAKVIEAQKQLEEIYNNLPSVPNGWDGWYYNE